MRTAALAALLLAAAAPARAQAPEKVLELERRLELLSQEVERLKLGEAAEPAAEKPGPGKGPAFMAPAASKVYRAKPNKVSVGGYGEMVLQDFRKRNQKGNPAGVRDEFDFVRAVLYVGYKFNDWILFNSEYEFEHGTTKVANNASRGEVSVEQAYIDFKLADPLAVRAGLVLVPMGFINEIHEPTTFHGAKRTSVESNIIPSTWRENGAGLVGEWGPFAYRAYALSGLQATSNTGVAGFSASSALRNGRSSGAKSFAEDGAFVARLDATPVQGVTAGASFYAGEADQGLAVHAVPVTLWEGHAQAEWRGAQVRALYAQGRIGNADTVNQLQGNAVGGNAAVGNRFFGGYVQAAYDLFTHGGPDGQSLSPFARWERYDTQQRVPDLWVKNPANSRVEYTAGLTYKPIPQVAVKGDYQWIRNQARTGVSQMNLALAFIF